jgi:hypothetical protein
MKLYPHRTVEEQANRLPDELREAYRNSQIDRITIFDGTEELLITGYAAYSYLEEKSYKTQPVRGADGSISEIEEYATFLTPRLIIKYNMMGIDDYRSLMKMLKRRNGFIIKCYDVEEDKIVRNEMYVATPSMPIIFQQYLTALGIQEYAIEMIGTNCAIIPTGDEPSTEEIEFSFREYEYVVLKVNLGYTWEDFVNSEVNTQGFSVVETNDGLIISNDAGITGVAIYDEFVKPSDYIFKDYKYMLIVV